MKVVLTENQLNNLFLIEEISIVLSENINENLNSENLRQKIRKLLLSGVAIASIVMSLNLMNATQRQKENAIQIAKQEEAQIKDAMRRDSITNIKIEACKKYMSTALDNQGYNEESTQLSPKAIVKAAEKHSFDLPLLIAAAHLESCFGATSRAKRTNSVYSVGAYDNGNDMVTYGHPDDSIEGYINLIKNDYLINGKTINDLLKPGGFVNKNGHRYASKKNYEALLKNVRNRIIRQYPELV